MMALMVMVMAITLIAPDDLHTAEIDEDFKVGDDSDGDDNYDINDDESTIFHLFQKRTTLIIIMNIFSVLQKTLEFSAK